MVVTVLVCASSCTSILQGLHIGKYFLFLGYARGRKSLLGTQEFGAGISAVTILPLHLTVPCAGGEGFVEETVEVGEGVEGLGVVGESH